jgi:hypothetical protein
MCIIERVAKDSGLLEDSLVLVVIEFEVLRRGKETVERSHGETLYVLKPK